MVYCLKVDDALNLAIYCDYENIAIGARDASLDEFDIALTLGRLLDKGKVVVKKAYADWDRFKSHKRRMHEAAFELIEIPHASYSGKNSADIRLVVDALDLCYTKPHVDTFVIMSGDSDFSPLVSKLRENNRHVIGLGVKSSSSDLLIENCDDFIYYDALVSKQRGARKAKSGKGSGRAASRRAPPPQASQQSANAQATNAPTATPQSGGPPLAATTTAERADLGNREEESRREEAFELVLDTVEALFEERDSNLWGSMVKQTLKRKRPNFSENAYGYRTFNHLLQDAERRGLLELQKDEKSGGYLIRAFGPHA